MSRPTTDYSTRPALTSPSRFRPPTPTGPSSTSEWNSRPAPTRIRAFVTVDPRSEYRPTDRFRDLLVRGAAGLKIHPVQNHIFPNDPSLYPLYSIATEYAVPVMFHTGSPVFPNAKHRFADPMLIDEVAADFPELTIICAHAGRGSGNPRRSSSPASARTSCSNSPGFRLGGSGRRSQISRPSQTRCSSGATGPARLPSIGSSTASVRSVSSLTPRPSSSAGTPSGSLPPAG